MDRPESVREAGVGRSTCPWIAEPMMALFVALPLPTMASDGRVELNQTCATAGGCVPGDAAGFPITLNSGGSYVLTCNLSVPNQNTNGIEINANDITIDFNGFTLAGPGTVPISTHVCTLPGTGVGILKPTASNGSGLTVKDGHIRGMGARGIEVDAALARIERMVLERNCGDGAYLGLGAVVTDTQARANGGNGIQVGTSGRVKDCSVDNNGLDGLTASNATIVTGSAFTTNVGMGLNGNGLATGNTATGNFTYGIAMTMAMGNYVDGNGALGLLATAGGLNVAGPSGSSTIDTGGNLGTIACNAYGGGSIRLCPP